MLDALPLIRTLAQTGAGDDVEELQASATGAWDAVVEALPRIGIALAVLAGFVVVGRLLRPLVRERLARRRTRSFAQVFSRLASAAMTIAGVLLAATIVFPSVRPVDLLTGAGILSVAVGFAFQAILQNLLAGLLLLFRQPFRGGDQVQVGDVAGTVEEINVRETVIVTFDGRRVLVPNAKVYTEVIEVQTARPAIRAHFVVGVAYRSDLAAARELALACVRGVEGVAGDPSPEALYEDLGASTVNLDVLFWCGPHQLEMRRTRSRALEAVKKAFDEHGIEMPTDIVALESTASLAAALQGAGDAADQARTAGG